MFAKLKAMVSPYVAGVEEGLLNQIISLAIRAFFMDSNVFLIKKRFDLEEGKTDYNLELPAGWSVHNVYRIELGGHRYINLIKENVLTLSSPPQADGLGAFLVYSIKPKLSALSGLPDDMMERYGEGLTALVVAKLKEMPGKPWSDLNSVSFFNNQYIDMLNRAKAESSRARRGL